MTIKLITNYPIAEYSPDHISPMGTMVDNSTDANFINEVFEYFPHSPPSVLDLGCSGGQLVVDFYNRGSLSIGLEGSDYSLTNGRANWPEHANKELYTCDVAKPYEIKTIDDKPILFDCITAWEVIEHIHPSELDTFFKNIMNHLKDDGIFCGTITTRSCVHGGYELHQSQYTKEIWLYDILPNYFVQVIPCPISHWVREEATSPWGFPICLRKK